MMSFNPWFVDSLQTFWQLKCPECTFDSKAEDTFKYHAVTKHPMSLVLFGKEFNYQVKNPIIDLIKTEISQEKCLEKSLNSVNQDYEQELEVDDIENIEMTDAHENENSSLHEELVMKEKCSELYEDLDTNRSVRRQLKRKCNKERYQKEEFIPSKKAVVAGLEFDIDRDFENVDDFTLALDSPDPCAITEEFTESNSYKKDEINLKVNGCAKSGLKRDSNQQTFSYQEEENHLLKIKKSRRSEELDQSYEQQEPRRNHIDELSTPEGSNEFIPNDYLSTIGNSECYDEQKEDKDNSQIPEVGSNYTSTKLGKSVVYHHEGFNYNKSKMNASGNLVTLRCQLSRSRKEEKCGGTARLDVNKKYIYLKAPHNHKPNEKSSKIQTFFKRVRYECVKLPTQLHKFKFQEMAEEFCEKEGLDPNDINFSMVESSCYRRAKKHMPSENPQIFEDMQETIDKYKDKVVEESVKQGKLCPICGKNIKHDLKPHMERVHEGKKDCLCLICGSGFYADKDLRAHIKSVHEKLKPHKCTLCDSSFFKSYGLKQHTETVHEGKKPFKCSLCDSDFGSKSSLNFHIVSVHEKKKPFKCSKCEMAFVNRHKLKRHTDVVHEGIKPYTCSMCDMAFGSRPHLRRHRDVVHEQKKPYLCPDCGLGFAQNDKLQRHISVVHKKEKPFSCMECNASFAYLYRLTRHTTAVHEGIKPKSKAPKK